jgi:hypothetical protein
VHPCTPIFSPQTSQRTVAERAASSTSGAPNFAARKERARARTFLLRATKSAPPLADTTVIGNDAPAIVRNDRARALKLKQMGDEQLTQGLIVPARLLYERAADLGFAPAALALAATYDEAALAHSNLRGVGSDPKAAAHWYERAGLPSCSPAAISSPGNPAPTPRC